MSDNTPGNVKRYTLQELSSPVEVPICVTVDDQCNHADTNLGTVSLDEEGFRTEKTQVCAKCSAVWDNANEEWMES